MEPKNKGLLSAREIRDIIDNPSNISIAVFDVKECPICKSLALEDYYSDSEVDISKTPFKLLVDINIKQCTACNRLVYKVDYL
jgi:hypothetical protein